MSDIPEWALDRALELASLDGEGGGCCKSDGHYYRDMRLAFARYIAAHEDPPVDPLLIEARELVATDNVTRTTNQVEAIRAGRAGNTQVDLVVRALKRGMELARSTETGEDAG